MSIYINEVTAEEVETLAEAVADLLRDLGLGNRENLRSLVVAESWEWPASDVETFVEELRMAGGFLLIPDAAEPE